MANKITTAVFALIMGFSFNSFAGTPETKGEAKPAEAQTTDESVEYYLDAGNMFRVKGTTGSCQPAPGKYCTYRYIGPEEDPELDQEPSHYEPVGDANYTWIQ